VCDDDPQGHGDRRRRHRLRLGGAVRVGGLAGDRVRRQRTWPRARRRRGTPRRARALVALERATQGIVERGLLEFTQARSLLQAVQDADWVIEAIPEDAIAKQKLFAAIEQVTGPNTLLTSSSSGIPPRRDLRALPPSGSLPRSASVEPAGADPARRDRTGGAHRRRRRGARAGIPPRPRPDADPSKEGDPGLRGGTDYRCGVATVYRSCPGRRDRRRPARSRRLTRPGARLGRGGAPFDVSPSPPETAASPSSCSSCSGPSRAGGDSSPRGSGSSPSSSARSSRASSGRIRATSSSCEKPAIEGWEPS